MNAKTAQRIELRRKRRHVEASIMKGIMYAALAIVIGALILVLGIIIIRGAGAVTWEMISQGPKGASISGGGGGILNAILGSIYLALGGTALSLLISVPVALYLNSYAKGTLLAKSVRLTLDVLWGIPSLLYGAFAFAIMLAIGLKASLAAGIITLALVELPILTRGMDEVLRLTPIELHHSTLALGATRWELMGVLIRQTMPGLLTATLLAFGRGIGDAAAVLFTAGYTDRMPGGLFESTASLPLTVFFQLSTPFKAAQDRAYAAALVLTVLVLSISIIARLVNRRFGQNVVQ
jgi:phosphate transport system permease protein